jgi:Exonuclease
MMFLRKLRVLGDCARSVLGSREFSTMATLRRLHQPFHYLAILDFEATCSKERIQPQEIIEFPILLFNTTTLAVDATFHSYVRPVHHPTLTEFCTKLTGIHQNTVDEAPEFRQVWSDVMAFLQREGLIQQQQEGSPVTPLKTFAWLTCGDWDLKTSMCTLWRLFSVYEKLTARYTECFLGNFLSSIIRRQPASEHGST